MTRKKRCIECGQELTAVIKYTPHLDESHAQKGYAGIMQQAYACFKCGGNDADYLEESLFREMGGHVYRDQIL